MQTLVRDLKHALRLFRENPGFAAAAITALASCVDSLRALRYE